MSNLFNIPAFTKQIAFIDPQVEDYASLVKGIKSDVAVVILEKDQDGIEQINNYLVAHQGNPIESLHLISHGNWGQLQLGSTQLSLETLACYSKTLQNWSHLLSKTAEILLYGCRVAGNAIGEFFVEQLSQLTQRAIAASTTLTGSAALGGTWDLAYHTGEIHSELALEKGAIATYPHTLGIIVANPFYSVGRDLPINASDPFTQLYIVDIEDGTSTKVGTIAFDSFAIARQSDTGRIYYVERTTGPTARVGYWDPLTGMNTEVGTVGSAVPSGIQFFKLAQADNGTIYGLSNGSNQLFSIDPNTGTATDLGAISGLPANGGDIAFDPNNPNTLFITTTGNTGQPFELYTVDVSAGTLTAIRIGEASLSNTRTGSLGFGNDGNLYASSGDRLVILDYPNVSGGIIPTLDRGALNFAAADFGTLPTLESQADLTIEKTDNLNNVAAGSTITYTISVTNNEPLDRIIGMVIQDTLPSQLVTSSISWTATLTDNNTPGDSNIVSGATGSNTNDLVVQLALGPQDTITILATGMIDSSTTSGTVITNEVEVPGIEDTSTGNDSPIDETNVANATDADLSLLKSISNTSPNVGDTLTYTLTLSNTGPANATGVEVSEQLPAGLTFVNSTPSQGTYNNGSGIWDVGTLNNSANATLEIIATVNAGATSLSNTAQVSASDQTDPDSTPGNNNASEDDQATVTTPVGSTQADLSLLKSISNTSPNVGDTLTYTLTLSNTGPANATGVEVSEQLPAGLTFVNSTPSQGTYNNGSGIWDVGTLNNSANATLEIIATVNAGATSLSNTAQVSASDQTDPDSTPGNNNASEDDQATVTTPVGSTQADLSLLKSISNTSPNVGDTLTYTLTLSNTGPANATGVEVSEQLPAGLTFVNSTPSQGTYNNGSGIWDVGTLNNSANATLEIIATVNAGATSLSNTAQVSASDQTDPDSTPGNNNASEDDQATVTTPVGSTQADLSLLKSISNTSPNVGDTLTYTLTLSNTGPANATGVEVSEQLPAGLTFVNSTPSQGTYNNGSGIWDVGTLNNSANATLEIIATVNAGATSLSNTAQVSASDQTDPDSTPGNNNASEDDQATVTTPVGSTQADLSLLKSISNTSPNVGDTLTYTLTLSNTGPANATGVEVSEQLPAGLTFVNSTPSQGTYNNGSGIWDVGTLNNSANATLEIIATVNAGATSLSNTAQVSASDQTDPDSTPGNNNASEDDQATVTTPVGSTQADLSLLKSISNTSPNVGDTLTYTLTLSNTGPANATGVEVSEQLPAGLTFVNSTPSQGTYNNGSGIWDVGTLNNSANATLEIIATVNAGATSLSNTAQVSASDQTDPDSTPGNNNASEDDQATVTTPVGSTQADLSLLKSISNTSPNVGDTLTYTLTLSNTGPANATGVEVSEQLPAGLTFVNSTPSQGTYNNGSGIWDVGTLNNSANATLEIIATVNAGATSLSNTAQVSASDQTDPDSTPGNNNASEDDQATVTTPVGSTNNPPDTQDKLSETIPNDEPAPVPTLTATDPDGDEIASFTITTLPPSEQGTLLLDGNPVSQNQVLTPEQASRLVFNPNPTFTGNATFNYTATDSQGNTDTTPAMVTLPVEAPVSTSPPEAQNKTGETRPNDEPSPVPTLTATDPDNDVSFYTVTMLPPSSQGTLLYNGVPVQAGQKFTPEQAGQLVFNPNPSFTGNATFEYTATDEAGNTDQTPAIVTLPLVAPTTTNPPEAQNKTADPRPNDEPSPVPTLTATDPDNDVSFFTVTTLPPANQGTLFYNGEPVEEGQIFTPEQAAQLVFEPNPNFTGDATFEYTATDEAGNTDQTPATVTLPLVAPTTTNPPEAIDRSGPIRPNDEPSPVPTLIGTDPDGDVSFFTVTTLPSPEEGTLFYNGEPVQPGQRFTPEQAGQLIFDPTSGFTGDATFEYTVTDTQGNTDLTPATVTLPIQAATDGLPPIATSNPNNPVPNNTPSPVTSLLGNDPDGELSFLRVNTTIPPEQGTLLYRGEPVQPGDTFTPEQAAQLVFDPNPNYTGDAEFTFTAIDDDGNESSPATVTIPIIGATPTAPPVANPATSEPITQGSSEPGSVPTLTGSDPDGIVSFFTIQDPPTPEQGTLFLNGEPVVAGQLLTPGQASQLTFVPNPNFTGNATFTFIATDETGNVSGVPGVVTLPVVGQTPVVTPQPNTGAPVVPAISPSDQTPTVSQVNETPSTLSFLGFDWSAILGIGSHLDCLDPNPEFYAPSEARVNFNIVERDFFGSEQAELLRADHDNNQIFGNGGYDLILAYQSNDTVFAGNGNDTAYGGRYHDILLGQEGADLLLGDQDNDTVFGGPGDDIQFGGQQNDWLLGGFGNDTAIGDRDNDWVFGEEGFDSLMGHFNQDVVFGGINSDTIHGGRGWDILFGGQHPDTVFGDLGNDTVHGNLGNDSLMGGMHRDWIYGHRQRDVIHAGQGDDVVFGGQEEDTVFGDRHDDTLSGDDGNDSLMGNLCYDIMFGDRGNDTMHGGQQTDLMFGGQHQDSMFGDRGQDVVSGDRGSDTLYGNLGGDFIFGGTENDTIYAGQQDDWIWGGQHQDSMYGDRGRDVVSGDRGNDTLYGNLGRDFMFGGTGQDTIFAGQQDDWAYGGQDSDFVSGDRGNDIVSGDRGSDYLLGNQDNDTLYGETEADWIHGGQQNDVLYGGQQNDTLNGDRNNDVLFGDRDNDSLLGNQNRDILSGGAGNDILFGGQEEDTLDGNQGDDTLSGDLGQDFLYGGDGIDVFVLRTGSAANNISLADIVADFQVGVDFIGLTGGLTFVDVTLEVLNNTTIVTITQTNQVLGIINGVTPEELIPAIIPVDIGLV